MKIYWNRRKLLPSSEEFNILGSKLQGGQFFEKPLYGHTPAFGCITVWDL